MAEAKKEALEAKLVSVTNTTRRGRVFRSRNGTLMRFPAGKTVEVELTDPQIKRYSENVGTFDEAAEEFRPALRIGEAGAEEKAAASASGEKPKATQKRRGRRR